MYCVVCHINFVKYIVIKTLYPDHLKEGSKGSSAVNIVTHRSTLTRKHSGGKSSGRVVRRRRLMDGFRPSLSQFTAFCEKLLVIWSKVKVRTTCAIFIFFAEVKLCSYKYSCYCLFQLFFFSGKSCKYILAVLISYVI